MKDENEAQTIDDRLSKIGKFNTASDLLAAYNALESEFTKRCQLIKRLQAELDAKCAQVGGSDGEAKDEVAATDGDGEITAQDTGATDDPVIGGVVVEAHALPEVDAAEDNADKTDVLDEIVANAAEYADALSAIPQVMDACIARYKHKLMDNRTSVVAPVGMAVIMPAKRPRDLREAKLLADEMLAKQ